VGVLKEGRLPTHVRVCCVVRRGEGVLTKRSEWDKLKHARVCCLCVGEGGCSDKEVLAITCQSLLCGGGGAF